MGGSSLSHISRKSKPADTGKEQTLGYFNSPGVYFSGDDNLSHATHLKIACPKPCLPCQMRVIVWSISTLSFGRTSAVCHYHESWSSLDMGKFQVSAHPSCRWQPFPGKAFFCSANYMVMSFSVQGTTLKQNLSADFSSQLRTYKQKNSNYALENSCFTYTLFFKSLLN